MMRIAVTYNDTEVYQIFGDTSYFKIYDVHDGKTEWEYVRRKVYESKAKGFVKNIELKKKLF